jgi:hypothetical protein
MDEGTRRKAPVATSVRSRLLAEEPPVRDATVLVAIGDDDLDAVILLPMVSLEIVEYVEARFSDLRVRVRRGKWRLTSRRFTAPYAA